MLRRFFSFSAAAAALNSPPQPPPERHTFSATMMDDNIASAESIITRWDPDAPNSSTISLFASDRAEARSLLRSVADLQQAMLFYVSNDCASSASSRSRALIRAQTLMQSAMRRLEREFHQILSSNRDHLDPDSLIRTHSASSDDGGSSDDEIRSAGESTGAVQTASAVAMEDLRDIADAMIAAGYGRECVQIFKLLRKSIVDEGLYRLGFERLTLSQLQKLDSELLDIKIRSWLGAAPDVVRTLFSGERMLCDHVFAGSDTIRNACFADISRDAAAGFLAFPELVAKLKRSPEKLFRVLDLYDAISELWQDIDAVFSSEAAAAVRSQTLASILKIAECARGTLADFEAAIQKDSGKSAIASGEIHPLTRYVMNYIVFLADYEAALDDIFADFPFEPPAALPEPLFDAAAPNSPSSYGSPRGNSLAPRVAWLVLVLLCKMDTKAESYRDVAQSYLFLANNLQYAVNKVRESKLRLTLGDDWVARHQRKARHYVAGYERLAWSRVAAAIPAAELAAEEAWERMSGFNTVFEEACAAQSGWVVADAKMREEVRASVTSMIVPAYRGFYERCRTVFREEGGDGTEVLKFAPEDVRAWLAEMFSGSASPGAGSSRESSRSGTALGILLRGSASPGAGSSRESSRSGTALGNLLRGSASPGSSRGSSRSG